VTAVPNGVDLDVFTPRALDRSTFWRRVLIEQPRGWLPGQPPGSARYLETDVTALAAGPVLLFVGRFTAVKRLDRLITAFGRAQERLDAPAGLVLVGGHPGEWEGEHPATTAARLGIGQVFLAGWHTQEELPDFFSAADVVVLTSDREQFGQVIIEGMACGVPAVATRSLGPSAIIQDGKTGWLVQPEDDRALATALADAIEDGGDRQQRGRLARADVRERFSWTRASTQLATLLEEVATARATPPGDLAIPPGVTFQRPGRGHQDDAGEPVTHHVWPRRQQRPVLADQHIVAPVPIGSERS
jgi:glycosyltransferase involved in cell wall biosynthesis